MTKCETKCERTTKCKRRLNIEKTITPEKVKDIGDEVVKKIVFILCLALILGSQLIAETSTNAIRVLVTVGGHRYDHGNFKKLFDDLQGVTYKMISMPQSADLLKPELTKDYDVLVMYDMVPGISAEQYTNFVALLKEGIGVISLHHNLAAHRYWPEHRKIIGGRWIYRPMEIDGVKYGSTTYCHDQTIDVMVVDKKHTITQGVTNFTVQDETYNNFYRSSDVHVLLTTDNPINQKEIAWTTSYGKSPVFYLQLGHDAHAWQHKEYPKLLLNAIRWANDQAKTNRAK